MNESSEKEGSKLESQLGTLFEATLEQKALDIATRVWENKFSGYETEDEQFKKEVDRAIDEFVWSPQRMLDVLGEYSSGAKDTAASALRSRLDCIVASSVLETTKTAITKLIQEEYQDRIRLVGKAVLNQVFNELEEDNDKNCDCEVSG